MVFKYTFTGECSVFLKKIILWMKTIHYPNTLRSHLVTIVPMFKRLLQTRGPYKITSNILKKHCENTINITEK